MKIPELFATRRAAWPVLAAMAQAPATRLMHSKPMQNPLTPTPVPCGQGAATPGKKP
jgi:hypothetical protein